MVKVAPSAALLVAIAVMTAACAADKSSVTESTSDIAKTSVPRLDNNEGDVEPGGLPNPEEGEGQAELARLGQSASIYPVGQEWRERVPLAAEFDILWRSAFSAWQNGIGTCMAERGFDYVVPPYLDEMRDEFYRAMNPLNEASIATLGYHSPNLPVNNVPDAPDDEAYQRALNGEDDDSTTGCGHIAIGPAYEFVEPLTERYQLLVNDLDGRVYSYATSSEGQESLESWRDCMTQKGYTFEDRDSPYREFGLAESVTADEILVRRADFECDVLTKSTETRSMWEAARVDEWLSDTSLQWTELGFDVAAVTADLST